jgi:8-oxo-dGTP pyrophosphatase MutT (NUDIX family)
MQDRRSQIRQLIASHVPADSGEAGHRARMLELAAAAGDVCSRSHFVPGHFTASAFILSPDGRDLLLVEHRRLGRWLQPGGHVDPEDSDLAAAASREVREETGVEAGPGESPAGGPLGLLDLDVHAIPARADQSEPAHQHFDVRFLWRAKSRELNPGAEVRAARWVPLIEVTALSTDDSVRRVIAKLERRLRPQD